MSQTLVDFSGNPSGAELMDDYLTPMQENILTSNSGTTRPDYAKEGTKWIDKTQTPWLLKLYDGSQDIVIGELDPNKHSFVATDPMTTAGDLIVEGDAGIPVRLAAGTAGHVLTSNGPGTLPSYQLGVYANTDLSNLTSTGQALFNAKQDVANLVQNLTSPSSSTYPSSQAVANESSRIINIMRNKASGYPNWAGISKPVNAVFTVDAPGLLFVESTHNNATGYVTINNFQMIYGSGNGFATDYYSITYLVDSGDVVKTTDATARVILFAFKTKV